MAGYQMLQMSVLFAARETHTLSTLYGISSGVLHPLLEDKSSSGVATESYSAERLTPFQHWYCE